MENKNSRLQIIGGVLSASDLEKMNQDEIISRFTKRIIKGTGGFETWESREFVVHKDRDISIAEFVIRCLANPACEDSGVVLNAIIEKRNSADSL